MADKQADYTQEVFKPSNTGEGVEPSLNLEDTEPQTTGAITPERVKELFGSDLAAFGKMIDQEEMNTFIAEAAGNIGKPADQLTSSEISAEILRHPFRMMKIIGNIPAIIESVKSVISSADGLDDYIKRREAEAPQLPAEGSLTFIEIPKHLADKPAAEYTDDDLKELLSITAQNNRNIAQAKEKTRAFREFYGMPDPPEIPPDCSEEEYRRILSDYQKELDSVDERYLRRMIAGYYSEAIGSTVDSFLQAAGIPSSASGSISDKIGNMISSGVISTAKTNTDIFAAHADELENLPDYKVIQPFLAMAYQQAQQAGREPQAIPLHTLIEQARQLQQEYQTEIIEGLLPAESEAIRAISVLHTDEIDYPLDKLNNMIAWRDLMCAADENGQLTIKAERRGAKTEANILFSITFPDNIPGIKYQRLTGYDKRVYIAVATLFRAGNSEFTATQIHKMMGYVSRASKSDIEKINDSLTKMRGTIITVDNIQEVDAKYKYPHYSYDGSLLPFERVKRVVNGKTTDAAIHLLREPPLIFFARQRKQITTFKLKSLQTPTNKNETNLLIEDYLLQRIATARAGNMSKRILFKTIAEHAEAVTKKQKQRLPEKVYAILDYWKSIGDIAGYSKEKDGVTISFKRK